MKLLSVRIQDFKLCKDVTVELSEHMFVLLGRNGSGKTTILQAIDLLKMANPAKPEYKRSINEKSYFKTQLSVMVENDDKEQYQYRLDCFFDKDEDANRPSYVLAYVKSKKAKNWLEYNSMEFSNEMMKAEVAEYQGYSFTLPKKLQIMMKIHNFVRNLTYISSTSFLKSNENSATISITRRGYYGRTNRENYKFLNDLIRLSIDSPDEYKRYLNVISRIGDGLVNNIDIKYLSVPTSSIKAYRGGVLQTVEENEELYCPIFHVGQNKLYNNQLSEGTFRSLALIFYILNHKTDLLIIEEPELSVHAELLGQIIELINKSSSDKQIVVSTHSERIVNMVGPQSISVVKRDNEGIHCMTLRELLSTKSYDSLNYYLENGGTLGDYIFSEI